MKLVNYRKQKVHDWRIFGVQTIFSKIQLNPRSYTQSHTLTLIQEEEGGGVMEPLPRVFDMLQDFKKILPSVESL